MTSGPESSSVPRLFDPARYPPVSVAIFQRLPEGNARAFAIASAIGSFRDLNGSSNRVRSGRQVAGVLVTVKRRPAVLQAIGISERQWRRYVNDWEARYVAHRCARGSVFLFAQPNLMECPGCHARLEIDKVPPSYKVNRGPGGLANGQGTTVEAVAVRPVSGSGTTASAAQERPQSERGSAAPIDGFHQGLEVGVPHEPEGQPELGDDQADLNETWHKIQRREGWTHDSDDAALALVLEAFPSADALPSEEPGS